MRLLKLEDIDDLALGAAVLGSGGGGDPLYDLLMAKQAIQTHGEIELITLEELEPTDLIVPVAFAGAPLVGQEKLPSGLELKVIVDAIERTVGRRPSALMPAEIGGGNALTPLFVSKELGIPILDADTLGRAFPQLQMSSCNLMGISPSPAFVADCYGNVAVLYAKDSFTIEAHARALTVSMGSSAAVGLYLMRAATAKGAIVEGTISQAIDLGRGMRSGLPFPGTLLVSGCIVDIEQEVKNGFLEGTVTIQGEERTKVHYQNEYLIAYKEGTPIIATPDLIVLLEQESQRPITTEMLKYGLKVDLFVLAAPDIWKTEKGLELVGPKYFGYL